MATLQETQNTALQSKLRRLGEFVDVRAIDDIFDVIFSRLGDWKVISCSLSNGNSIAVRCRSELLAEVALPRAKSVLRLMCARLAVRSSEWARREVSPYGDTVEFELSDSRIPCRIILQNTPDAQGIEISERADNDPSSTAGSNISTTAYTPHQ